MTVEARDAVLAAHDRWYEALNAMFAGDPEPFAAIYSHRDDTSYMPAEGGLLLGFEAAFSDWRAQAARSLGGRAEVERVHVLLQGDLAGTQTLVTHHVRTPDGAQSTRAVRETSLYRREGGEWRVVMHQADAMQDWKEVMGELA
jgi:uncharacterized protein (TIGR02246 family)